VQAPQFWLVVQDGEQAEVVLATQDWPLQWEPETALPPWQVPLLQVWPVMQALLLQELLLLEE
jgi:hypothetical protein